MSLYLIHVNGLLHHATSHVIDHCAYVAKLREAGHHVTTEERIAFKQARSALTTTKEATT